MAPENPIQYQALPEDDTYREIYANNVYFEPSAWDLKAIFGQLDQRHGKIVIRQHTAVTMPWTQAKIVFYWLKGYLEFQEATQGKVIIPPSGIPPEVPPPSEEMKKSDPNVEKAYAIFKRLRDELIQSQK